MRKKLSIVFWTIKQAFILNPLRFIMNLLLYIIRGVLPTFLAVKIGDTVNEIATYESGKSLDVVIFSLIILVLLFLFNSFITYASGIITSALDVNINIKIKEKFVNIVNNIPLRNFDNSQFQNEFSNAKDGFDSIIAISDNLLGLVSDIITLVTTIVALATIWPWMLIFAIPAYLCGYKLNMKNTGVRYKYWKDTTSDRRMSRYLTNIFFTKKYAKELRCLHNSDYFYQKWSDIRNNLREERNKINKSANSFFAIYQLFLAIMNIVAIIIGIVLFVLNYILVGQIVTIWQLNKNLLYNIQSVNSSYADLYYNNEKIELAKNFIERFANEAYESESHLNKSQSPFAFQMNHVSFSYNEDRMLFYDLNLEIKHGETIAICGENGSGKTTLVKLMCGLYLPDSGTISVNGIDTRQAAGGKLSSLIGIAFQDFVCYPYSVRENIGFGSVSNIDCDEKIEAAAEKGEFDKKLREIGGLETMLSKQLADDGTELSGGEWQRVALSRANMNDKPIMIYDEPAAKLDPISELKQFERIKTLTRDRNAILISHRIGFARLASRIIVVKDGRIVEDGSHEKLISLGGEYAKLFNEQRQWYYNEAEEDEINVKKQK